LFTVFVAMDSRRVVGLAIKNIGRHLRGTPLGVLFTVGRASVRGIIATTLGAVEFGMRRRQPAPVVADDVIKLAAGVMQRFAPLLEGTAGNVEVEIPRELTELASLPG
jgi:hypothetical protein